jgi:hypothetical protein
MKINEIYCEPCIDTLKRMPNDFLDCVITSPPYWQLRDYGYEGQWGMEPTYQQYLEHLWEMMDEIWRVLKPTGTVWINLGDTYSRTGGSSIGRKQPKSLLGNTKLGVRGGNCNGVIGIMDKCLLLLPHRFAIGCIDRGWIIRNDIIWAKRNGMPESVTDRFSKKHEYFFFMVKQEKYFFDLNAVRDKVKAESLKRYEYNFAGNKAGADRDMIGCPQGNAKHLIPKSERPQYSVIDSEYRKEIIEVRDLPEHEELRQYLSKFRKDKGITIQEIEDIFQTQAPHHWFEKNGSYPSKEDWIKLKEILSLDDTYDFSMTNITEKSGLKENNPMGKNPGDVADFWDITTKANKSQHYASYNDELLKKPVLAGCPEFVCNKCGKPREKNVGLTDCGCNAGFSGGLIYDPFMGTGSTAEVAYRSNRNYIGSEMSEKYIKIANQRLKPFMQQQKLF